VISIVAFCPQPPIMVPEVAMSAAPELDQLRAACAEAIRRLGSEGRQLVVLGAGEVSRSHSPLARGSLAGYGLPLEVHLGAPGCGGAIELPLSLTIGAWLVNATLGERTGAIGVSVGPEFGRSRAAVELMTMAEAADVALLVMGDGSARRSAAAPGSLDPRAARFDDAVVGALREGDASALAALDEPLGEALLAAGVPAWRAAGRVLDGGSYDAELLFADDPYGVGYYVASWTTRG
jgi:hypothetical protein